MEVAVRVEDAEEPLGRAEGTRGGFRRGVGGGPIWSPGSRERSAEKRLPRCETIVARRWYTVGIGRGVARATRRQESAREGHERFEPRVGDTPQLERISGVLLMPRDVLTTQLS